MDILALQAIAVSLMIITGILSTEFGNWGNDDDGWGF
jgi:hypothetical protein